MKMEKRIRETLETTLKAKGRNGHAYSEFYEVNEENLKKTEELLKTIEKVFKNALLAGGVSIKFHTAPSREINVFSIEVSLRNDLYNTILDTSKMRTVFDVADEFGTDVYDNGTYSMFFMIDGIWNRK